MRPPREILERFPGLPTRCHWYPIQQTGFSGATVWRGEFDGSPLLALKCHPSDYPLERQHLIEKWWIRAGHLPFVSELLGSHDHWELAAWKLGKPCHHFEPNDPKLDAACAAILQLHDVWKPFGKSGPIPGIARRIELLQSWNPTSETGLRAEAMRVVFRYLPEVMESLTPWRNRRFPLQPILADVHAEHVLFTGNAVTGIVDFGAMKLDHVAVDAARYLGDTCDGQGEAFQRGCEIFARHHGEETCPPELVELLDRSGTLAAIVFWLKREERTPEATARLARQIERWHRLTPTA